MKLLIPKFQEWSTEELVDAIVELINAYDTRVSFGHEYYKTLSRKRLEKTFIYYFEMVYTGIADNAKSEFFANLTKNKLAEMKISRFYQYE